MEIAHARGNRSAGEIPQSDVEPDDDESVDGLVLLSEESVPGDFAVVGEESLVVLGLLGDEYRSEYQPPPLRMKPPPREICRRASA